MVEDVERPASPARPQLLREHDKIRVPGRVHAVVSLRQAISPNVYFPTTSRDHQ
jgi:hypothetical protein